MIDVSTIYIFIVKYSLGGQEKRRSMECLLNDLRTFGINADQWTTAAQDEGESRKTAEQGGTERFMAK